MREGEKEREGKREILDHDDHDSFFLLIVSFFKIKSWYIFASFCRLFFWGVNAKNSLVKASSHCLYFWSEALTLGRSVFLHRSRMLMEPFAG